jgi:hypothetical protein
MDTNMPFNTLVKFIITSLNAEDAKHLKDDLKVHMGDRYAEVEKVDIEQLMRDFNNLQLGGKLKIEGNYKVLEERKEYSRGEHARCKGIKKDGKQCGRKAVQNGKCNIHAAQL